jgi:hypothetical protein
VLLTIVRCVVPDGPVLPPEARRAATLEAAAFVGRALAAAPFHIRVGERIFRVALWAWLLPVAWRASVGRGPSALVERAVERFASLAGPAASIVRLYRSLAALAFLESDGVVERVGGTSARARQESFRAIRARAVAGGAP